MMAEPYDPSLAGMIALSNGRPASSARGRSTRRRRIDLSGTMELMNAMSPFEPVPEADARRGLDMAEAISLPQIRAGEDKSLERRRRNAELVGAMDSPISVESGSPVEAAAEVLTAILRGKAAGREFDEQEDERTREEMRKENERGAIRRAMAVTGDDPREVSRQRGEILSEFLPAQAFDIAQGLTMSDLERRGRREDATFERDLEFEPGFVDRRRSVAIGDLEAELKAREPFEIRSDARRRVAAGGENARSIRAATRLSAADWNRSQTDFKTIRDSYATLRELVGRQEAAGNAPSATTDMSMIYTYMRMLDPTSVVREGEFATAQNAAGIPEQVRNMYNRAARGTRLSPEQRTQFLADAESIYSVRSNQHARDLQYAREVAAAQDLDPDQVARDLRLPDAPSTAAPPGQRVDGMPARGDWVGQRYFNDAGQPTHRWDGTRWVPIGDVERRSRGPSTSGSAADDAFMGRF